MREIYDWDTGKYMGKIPEAAVTYNVIGNMNEYQLAIAETTYGGLEQLQVQPGAIMDYGSLIYVALQRSKSAREAIATIATLMEQYGYASEGESFSIADPKEVWIMDIIGKGAGEVGAVWVAVKIPGFVFLFFIYLFLQKIIKCHKKLSCQKLIKIPIKMVIFLATQIKQELPLSH